MYRSIVVFAALLALVYGQTAVSQCTGSPGDLPISVKIEGCTTPPCSLPQLQDAVIDVEFNAPREMSKMTTLATAYLSLFGIEIPIPYDLAENAETCNFLQNATCPVAQGQLIKYQLRMFIQEIFPVGVSLDVEFRIVDEVDQPVVCLRVPIVIAPPAFGITAE